MSSKVSIIDRQEQIDELAAQCRAHRRFAFDTEFVMEDRYEADLCLIQIATPTSVSLIDPFLRLNLGPIWSLVHDDTVETVVHAGQEDLAFCLQRAGGVPHHVFDVQIAAGLVGFDYPISLQKLIQATLHVGLHKSKTLTDWRRRPMTTAQIRYAAEDVQYLLHVREHLFRNLCQRNRIEWAAEEFGRFEDSGLYRLAEEDKLLKLKGTGALKPHQRAIVRELLPWREKLAEKLNRPVRVVLKDHLIVEIARHELSSSTQIRELRGLNLRTAELQAIARLVSKAQKTPRADCPPRPKEPVETPRQGALAALVTAVTRNYCLEHGISYGLVATQKSIRELIRHRTSGKPADRASVNLLNGWRGQSVGAVLDEVLSGRHTVRVASPHGVPTLQVGPPKDSATN